MIISHGDMSDNVTIRQIRWQSLLSILNTEMQSATWRPLIYP